MGGGKNLVKAKRQQMSYFCQNRIFVTYALEKIHNDLKFFSVILKLNLIDFIQDLDELTVRIRNQFKNRPRCRKNALYGCPAETSRSCRADQW